MLLLKEDLTTVTAFVMYLHPVPPKSPHIDPPKQPKRHFGKRSGEVRYSLKFEVMALDTGEPLFCLNELDCLR